MFSSAPIQFQWPSHSPTLGFRWPSQSPINPTIKPTQTQFKWPSRSPTLGFNWPSRSPISLSYSYARTDELSLFDEMDDSDERMLKFVGKFLDPFKLEGNQEKNTAMQRIRKKSKSV